LSASGKSTLASHLYKNLQDLKCKALIVDGDTLREEAGFDLGFSDQERSKNAARAVTLASKKFDEGYVVIVALISPFTKDREFARSVFGPAQFIEVYVNTPLVECEKRDPKGLYKKARQGLIKLMTGIDSPYEAPLHPTITINTINEPIEQSVKRIILSLI